MNLFPKALACPKFTRLECACFRMGSSVRDKDRGLECSRFENSLNTSTPPRARNPLLPLPAQSKPKAATGEAKCGSTAGVPPARANRIQGILHLGGANAKDFDRVTPECKRFRTKCKIFAISNPRMKIFCICPPSDVQILCHLCAVSH